MADFIFRKHFVLSMFAFGVLFGAFLFWSDLARAINVTSISPPITTGDINSDEILDGTIVDADISNSAGISATKLFPNGTTGTVLLANGTNIATTTGLRFATSSGDLYVFSGRVHATSTNFNGVNYSWPSADGSANQILTTNGSGSLSFSSLTSGSLTQNFTAASAVAAGDVVLVASSTVARADAQQVGGGGSCNIGFDATQERCAHLESYPGGVLIATSSVVLFATGAPADTVIFELQMALTAGPLGTVIASSSVAASGFNGTNATTTITWNHPIYLDASSTVAYVIRRSGSTDTSNYVSWRANNSTPCSGQNNWYYSSSAWATMSDRCFDGVFTTLPVTAGNVVVAAASYGNGTDGVIGVATAAIAQGATGAVTLGGIASGYTGLTTGARYYLCTIGVNICKSAGVISKQVGRAISTTEIKLLETLYQ